MRTALLGNVSEQVDSMQLMNTVRTSSSIGRAIGAVAVAGAVVIVVATGAGVGGVPTIIVAVIGFATIDLSRAGVNGVAVGV